MRSNLVVGFVAIAIAGLTIGVQQLAGQSQAASQRVAVSQRATVSGNEGVRRDTGPLQRLVTIDVRNVPLHQALDEVGRQSGLMLAYGEHVIPAGRRVSVTLRNVAASQAFAALLSGLNAKVIIPEPGVATIVRGTAADERKGAVDLTGTVTDAATKQPIRGATVMIQGTTLRATTREDGTFRIVNIPAGTYSVMVRILGYSAQTKQVTVGANGNTVLDFALAQAAAANPLERVVVTGTLVATEQKALSSPITVVDSKEIQDRGITDIQQLFRGSIPGVIANDVGGRGQLYGATMNIRGSTQLGATAQGATRFKTYVDGVEVADDQFVNNIDPSIIDHIEIIRGPQASTMYGSQAINGVMQIFTKKGAMNGTGPHLVGTLSTGFIQSDFTNGATPQHDDNLSVTGSNKTGDMSYSAGLSYGYTGPAVPASTVRTQAGHVGGRMLFGPVTVDASARYSNRKFEQPNQQYFMGRTMSGEYKYSSATMAPVLTHYTIPQQTLAGTITYEPSSRWQHVLTVGQDRGDQQFITDPPHLTGGVSPAPSGLPALDALQAALASRDSLYTLLNIDVWRNSANYALTNTTNLSPKTSLVTTVGGEIWTTTASATVVLDALTSTGSISSVNNFVSDPSLTPLLGQSISLAPTLQNYHSENKGVFVQTRLGLSDALFLTAGVRAEDNTNFGNDYGLDYAPRFGIAYTWNATDDLSLKARAGYGKATRPPSPSAKLASIVPNGQILANPDLGPETQRGTDYGIEAYLGSRASLVVSYYDQKAVNLITQQILSAPGDPRNVYKYVNLGTVHNTGWEFQATGNVGGLALNGTYSLFNSRILAIDPSDVTHQYQIGDRILGVPKYSGALSGTYTLFGTVLRVDLSRIGPSNNIDYAREADLKNDRLAATNPPSAPRLTTEYPAYTRVAASITRPITGRFDGFIRADNLTNDHTADFHNTDDIIGRSVMFGIRLH